MTAFLFLFFVMSLSIILEAVTRSAGLLLPFAAIGVFYCTYLTGPLTGIVIAAITGFLLDSLFFYPVPVTSLALTAVIPLAWFLRDGIENDSPLLLMAAGALLPLIVLLPPIPVRADWQTTVLMLPHLFVSSMISALLLPLMTVLFDRLCGQLALTRFRDIKELRRNQL